MSGLEDKQRLRETMKRLPPPSPETRARVVRAVAGWLRERRPGVVVGFLAMGDEIDMSPLVDELPEITFALTRTAPGLSLTVHPFSAPRERHSFGFEQPAADSPRIEPGEIDVVLVPGLAFSLDGRRLGRGAGYYDRFLAGLDADTVALTTSSRLRDDLPREEHDVLMRWIATEDGVKAVLG
ncbi:MAG: 5-formyltetrahydrofolate cyclo-ligase [Acidimicrobiia bacterium]